MTTPNRGIPYVPEGVLDPAAAVNEALRQIDAKFVPAIIDFTAALPGSPSDGDMYIMTSGAHDTELAQYVQEGDFWQYYAPQQVGVVLNKADGGLYAWDFASAWVPAVAGSGTGAAAVVVLSGTAYTLDDLTPGGWHVFTNNSAVTITVEDDSDEPMPANAEFGIEVRGTAGLSIVSADLATIIPPKNGSLDMETDDFAVLKRTAEDEYKLIGSTADAP